MERQKEQGKCSAEAREIMIKKLGHTIDGLFQATSELSTFGIGRWSG